MKKEKSALKLKVQVETVNNVTSDDLDEFIHAVTGRHYECVTDEEWPNDSEHRFYVKPFSNKKVDAYDVKKWNEWKTNVVQADMFMLRTILDGLCTDGKIVEGVYIISVCW